jgi:hypothetical protein
MLFSPFSPPGVRVAVIPAEAGLRFVLNGDSLLPHGKVLAQEKNYHLAKKIEGGKFRRV